jgi:hypothetical protein
MFKYFQDFDSEFIYKVIYKSVLIDFLSQLFLSNWRPDENPLSWGTSMLIIT